MAGLVKEKGEFLMVVLLTLIHPNVCNETRNSGQVDR